MNKQCAKCGCTHFQKEIEDASKTLREINIWFERMQPYMTIPDWKKQRELLDKINESAPVGWIKMSNITA